MEERRVSFSSSLTGIEGEPERIAVVDAVMESINLARMMQNDVNRNAKASRRYNVYARPMAVTEQKFFPHLLTKAGK